MLYIKERLDVISAQLKKQALRDVGALTDWEMKKGNYVYPADVAADGSAWQSFDSLKDHWYGPDGHYWFKSSYTVPPELDGKALWLVVHTQIDGWDAKNPQFLLFVDGQLAQGMDTNHREVLLAASAQGGHTYDLQLHSYTGTQHSEFRLIGKIVEVVRPVYDLYYDIRVPLLAFSRMDEADKARRLLEKALSDTINLIDFRTVYSEAYFRSVAEASAHIKKAVYEELAGFEDVIATCIGHTHIDVAWLWTVEQTKEKASRSFATVLKLMEEYPDYKFMSSQPQLYAFVKKRFPELYQQIKVRIAEGRWEAEGGMWLEADCNVTSGESLVRQFYHGKRFFRDEFGVDNKILWLPDVFGYSAAIPQICKKSGIDYFMTTKVSWNQFNKIPCDTFLWRGIDGSEVFTHFISTLDVGQSAERFITTYNGQLHPDAIMGGWERYQEKSLNNDILISYGYGDGGGGPTREMLEISERMAKGLVGIPKVRQAPARQYFDELFERVKDDKRLPCWVGELYFEYHRGTYTSMARNKRANRKSELLLMDLEFLAVWAERACGAVYPADVIYGLWETVLLNQFHDILPGSSIKEVYEVTKAEYEEIAATGQALLDECLSGLSGQGQFYNVYNTLGYERADVVTLDIASEDSGFDCLRDEAGHSFPVQRISDREAVAYVEGIPSKGCASFSMDSSLAAENPFVISDRQIETPFYRVSLDGTGAFSSLFDKEEQREVLMAGCCGNLFRMYEDKPMYYDNWDIDIYYTEKFWDIQDVSAMRWTETGPVRATLHIERSFSNSVLHQDIYFYAKSRRIDFVTWVDWKENQHLLKVLFPLDVHSDEATFDIQFGNVTRKTHKNTSWDKARFESCAQKWMDISEGAYGVALMNDCKYGHSVYDGVVGLTLIKSGIEPNPTTDQEEHVFTYSLLPHQGSWREAGVPKEASFLNQPAYVVRGAKIPAVSLVSSDKENIVVETVKKSYDGEALVLRVYENYGSRTRGALHFGSDVKAVWDCDLQENKLDAMTVENADGNGVCVPIVMKPYEIRTIRVE